jgi:WD40 repeat protein
VWELAGGRCTATLEGHTDEVTNVAVSADGRLAVSGSADLTVRVWDLAGGRCVAAHPINSEDAHTAWETVLHRAMPPAVGLYGLKFRGTAPGGGLVRFPYASLLLAASSADGRHVVAGDSRGSVFLLRLHTRSG